MKNEADHNLAGLFRISDFDGGAIWTAIDHNEVSSYRYFDKRASLRDEEDLSEMRDLQTQLLQRNKSAKVMKD